MTKFIITAFLGICGFAVIPLIIYSFGTKLNGAFKVIHTCIWVLSLQITLAMIFLSIILLQMETDILSVLSVLIMG